MKHKILLTLLAVAPAFAGFAQSQVLTAGSPVAEKVSVARLNRIDELISTNINAGFIKGAAAFVARDGKTIYNKAFGMADAESHTPMRVDHIFRIASQTKAITSVAVMMLFEEGKLLLDDPISKYIPAFSHPQVLDQFNEKDATYTTVPAKREITIRDLLTHTSGIDYAQIGTKQMNAIYAKAGIIAGLTDQKLLLADMMNKLGKMPLHNQPGAQFTYGLSVDVLGYLVEKLSGKSLDRFFKERIFEPLGMKDTYFYLPPSKYNRLVSVYTWDKNKRLIKYSSDMFYGLSPDYPKANGTYFSGGGGLSSTMYDYALFLQMMLNGGTYNGHRLLSRHTVNMMTGNQIGDLPFGKNKFGLGFMITTAAGQTTLGQTEGSFEWGGAFGTEYWADPKERLVCLLYVQDWGVPLDELHDKFKVAVYQALE